MIEFIQSIVFFIWIALTIGFLLGMINPQAMLSTRKKATRADILIIYLLIPTALLFAPILVVVMVQNSYLDKYGWIIVTAALTVFLFASLTVIGLIKPSYVIRWGNLRNRTMVLLHYGTPILLIVVVVMFYLRPILISHERDTFLTSGLGPVADLVIASEGRDCGAYYTERWGQPASLFVNDDFSFRSFRHVTSYNQFDVYLETSETTWGTLHRTLIFVNDRLEGMEMVASSPNLSFGELGTIVIAPCYAQRGAPKEERYTLSWGWNDSNPTVIMTRKALDGNSIHLFMARGGSEMSIFAKHVGAGDILGIEDLLGMHSN